MDFLHKVKRKIKEGFFTDLYVELCWLWQYIRWYRGTIFIHIVLDVAAIAMGLCTSVASKFLIDAVTGRESGYVVQAAAFMAGALLGNILLKSLVSYVGAHLNVRVQNEIQAEIYQKILNTDWQSLEKFRSGDLMQRLTSDVGTVAGGVTGFMPSLIAASVQFIGALGIMLYYDPIMALIALLGIPVAVLGSRVLLRRMRDHNKKMKSLTGDVMAFYEDSLNNLTSIKAFDITGDFYTRMTDLQHFYRDEYLTYNLFSVRTGAAISLLGVCLSAGCFGWGAYRLWTGVITFGSMTMFLQLSSTLSGAFSSLIGMVSGLISLTTSAARLMEVTQLPEEIGTAEQDYRKASQVRLEIRDAAFGYADGDEVLHDVSFSAGEGDLVALTGPSGEGKTTMLRLLLGLVQPDKGTARLYSSQGDQPLSAATRSAFAYVPQGNSMFVGTIAENLRLTDPDATDADLQAALETACAWEFVRQLPDGIHHKVGGRGRGLSEGQAQRLAVARALLRKAPILLLDEATSALDLDTEQQLLRNLMENGLVRTCIFVTHRAGTAKFCTRQYRLEEGTLHLVRDDTGLQR